MKWTWTFPGALPPNNIPVKDKDSIIVCWPKPTAVENYTKTYQITLTAQEDTCENTTTTKVTIKDLFVNFTIDKLQDCNGGRPGSL